MVLDLSSLEADNASSAFFTGAELQATSFKLQGKPAQTFHSLRDNRVENDQSLATAHPALLRDA